MFRVGGTGGDPAAEGFFLGSGERVFGGGWRHDLVRVVGEDAGDGLAGVGVGGDDGAGAAFGGFEGGGTDVESELAFTAFLVGAVAFEAVVGKDGADVLGEVRSGFCGRGGGGGDEDENEARRRGHHGRNGVGGGNLTGSSGR